MGPLDKVFGGMTAVESIVKAPKEIKNEKMRGNKYINSLDIKPVTDIDQPSGAVKIAASDENKDNDKSKYIIPAAALGIAAIRAGMTGNALQLPLHDIPSMVAKVVPKMPDAVMRGAARSQGVSPHARFLLRSAEKAKGEMRRSGAKGSGSDFASNLKSGAGFAAGLAGADFAINKVKGSNQEKTASEMAGVKGYIKKVLTEGIAQPSIQAIPMYMTPVALSYAINKDVKNDFSPVKDNIKPSKEEEREINKSSTDYRSRNNVAINNAIMKFAMEKSAAVAGEAASTAAKGVRTFVDASGRTRTLAGGAGKNFFDRDFYTKDWDEFVSELPLNGLRAVSLAVPMTALAVSDPVQKYRQRTEAQAQAEHDKELINQAVKAQKKTLKAQKKMMEQSQHKKKWGIHYE